MKGRVCGIAPTCVIKAKSVVVDLRTHVHMPAACAHEYQFGADCLVMVRHLFCALSLSPLAAKASQKAKLISLRRRKFFASFSPVILGLVTQQQALEATVKDHMANADPIPRLFELVLNEFRP